MAKPISKPNLEDLYELSDDYLQSPQSAAFRPAIIYGADKATHQDRLLKVWWKDNAISNSELRELWNHERLHVARIMNFPGAEEVMIDIVEMIETQDAFCVVLEPGPTPLSSQLTGLKPTHWLRSLETISSRRTLWRNFSRLAEALGILHSQGLIHGGIEASAVFSEGGNGPDFRLAGFEWSLRIGSPAAEGTSFAEIRRRIDKLIYSYADDWKALGNLFCGLLGLDPTRLRDDDPFASGAKALDISDSEITFLRSITDPDSRDALDARSLSRRAEAIAGNLTANAPGQSSRLVLLMGMKGHIADVLYQVTKGELQVDSLEEQMAFVEGDLATDVRLAASGKQDFEELYLLTETLAYKVKALDQNGDGNWQVAVVMSCTPRAEARLPSDREVVHLPYRITVVRNRAEAAKSLSQLRTSAILWTSLFAPAERQIEDPETRILASSVLLVQLIEAILKSLDVLPVRVSRTRLEGASLIATVVPRAGSSRDRLATLVKEPSTALVMERMFESDDTGVDVEWRLSTSGALASREATDIKATFISVTTLPSGQSAYDFRVAQTFADQKDLFLRPKGDVGTESLIKRKLRTSGGLAERRDLVAMMTDPRRRVRKSNDILDKDAEYEQLDDPKKAALESIWTTTPTHLVVGPPGVGKTKLVTEVVRRRLADEPSSRILVSAQSHQALDHLLTAVRKHLTKHSPDSLIVRSRGADDAISTDADLKLSASTYVSRALGSTASAQLPANLRKALEELSATLQRSLSEEMILSGREAAGVRALKALVLESANVVFSTTNSLDVERLLEDGAQFDWAIIEEAAKASGPELIAALSLAGRRLLIGDHHQLPPFDSERVESILLDKTSLLNAVEAGMAAVGATFFESGADELATSLTDDAFLASVSQSAIRVLQLFKSLVVEDEARRPMVAGAKYSVSSELLLQHRMDPAIAELISACFYNRKLETGIKRIEASSDPLPFSFGNGIPQSPILFVDTGFVARTGSGADVERGRPRWHNPTEANLVGQLLGRMQSTGQFEKPISIAVLSPYRAQVERLTPKVEKAIEANPFASRVLYGFAHDNRMLGTVDSAQGSEADLVIVSLVRNNHRSGASALGFLRDSRRMNVLLSRAKLQLVLVGSLEFLREATRHSTDDGDLAFVRTLLETIDRLAAEKSLRGTPKVEVVPASTLAGTAR